MSKTRSEQAGILVLGQTISTLANVIAPLLLVRVMSKTDLGVLSALLVIFNTAAMMGASGFSRLLLYYLPGRERAERGAIARKSAWILTGIGVLAGLSILGAEAVLQPLSEALSHWVASAFGGAGDTHPPPVDEAADTGKYLWIVALYVFAEMPTRMFTNLLIVESRAKAAAGTALIKSIGVSLATLIPAALGADIGVVVGAITAFSFAYLLLFIGYLRRLYPATDAGDTDVTSLEMLRLSIPLGMTDVVNILNHTLDRYLVMFFFAAAALAEYQVGAWRIPVISTVAYAVGNVYLPRFKELYLENRHAEAIQIWRDSVSKVSLIVVPVTLGFMVAAEELIRLAFTDEYMTAVPVLRWYLLLTLGRVTQFAGPILAAGRTRDILWASVVTLGSNLVISIPFTMKFGLAGPAMGTAVAFIPSVMIYCVFIAKASGVPFTRTFPLLAYLKVVSVGAVAAAIAWGVRSTVTLPDAAMLPLLLLIVGVAFSVIGSAVGLIDRDDWQFVRDWMRLKILK